MLVYDNVYQYINIVYVQLSSNLKDENPIPVYAVRVINMEQIAYNAIIFDL